MQSLSSSIVLASIAACLVLYVDAFVSLNSPSPSFGVSSSSRTHVHPSSTTVRRHFTTRQGQTVMMAAGKKRRRRKGSPDAAGGTSSASATSTASKPRPASRAAEGSSGTASRDPDAPSSSSSSSNPVANGVGELGAVLQGDKGIEALFTDDWSDMPANDGMVKSNVALPDLTGFKPSKRAEASLEQREKKTAVGLTVGIGNKNDAKDEKLPDLTGFESKLTPIVDREAERLAKTAAERFEEGPIVKALKTATWFSICTLVLWEVYINSPWFQAPTPPPIS